MTGYKWAGIIVSTVVLSLEVLANILVMTLTKFSVPLAVNVGGAIVAALFAGMAFSAHLYDRSNAKLDLLVDLVVNRFDELEDTLGDRNSGFVEGYLLSQRPAASVVPFTPRAGRSGGSGSLQRQVP